MATTAQTIVTMALRRLQVISRDDPAEASDASFALGVMNMMMHGWKSRGVDISHTDYTLASTVTLPEELHEGLVGLLAKRLAPDFSRPTPTGDGFDLSEWWQALSNAYLVIADQTIDSGLLRLPSQGTWRQ